MTREESAAMISEMGLPGYPHPRPGIAVTCVDFEIHSDSQRIRYGPPLAPSRVMSDYDGDGEEFEVTLTDEELAAAEVRYVKAYEEWKRNGGVLFVNGQTTITVTFRFQDGSWQKAFTTPGAERWIVTEEVWTEPGFRP